VITVGLLEIYADCEAYLPTIVILGSNSVKLRWLAPETARKDKSASTIVLAMLGPVPLQCLDREVYELVIKIVQLQNTYLSAPKPNVSTTKIKATQRRGKLQHALYVLGHTSQFTTNANEEMQGKHHVYSLGSQVRCMRRSSQSIEQELCRTNQDITRILIPNPTAEGAEYHTAVQLNNHQLQTTRSSNRRSLQENSLPRSLINSQ
jgi:hypothetical protein